ncbi:hypothetical protein [Pyxidicoccus caerfyrddinensis]|uniref:hypothetical protein n=1 Tax=Pyxidicoccus caerfyrddinensis TaxID=2709663 RepID=UPI0013D91BB1|nr:hypothetical protein [Pyxidicoccus caerfyrddinensis]
MSQKGRDSTGGKRGSVWLLGAMLAVSGCSKASSSDEASGGPTTQSEARAEGGSTTSKLSDLPAVTGLSTTTVFAQRLAQATPLEETTAIHVKLAPPANKELESSLVRVVGDPKDPVVLFSSDALAQLGRIPKSPGPGFFTLFSSLKDSELDRRTNSEKEVAEGKFGPITKETILFNGRHPAARFEGLSLDARAIRGGGMVPIAGCPALPATSQNVWDKALLIRDPAVVQNPARTWDPCTGAGTQGGKWTFSHLIKEMAQDSGTTAEDFVMKWLSNWLNDYTVNGDLVQARQNMFSEVIQPWATASGQVASLVFNTSTNKWQVSSTGPLNLDIAPFRLLAIVNRIDLAGSSGGYGGSSTAGELRFVFGMTKPTNWGAGTEATCNLKLFTTIIEYGVPRTGCQQVIDWARDWAQLGTHTSFDATYLTKLESMTESVVLHGSAPAKGNKNALNQLRTNEISLVLGGASPQWELREFQLADENLTDTAPDARTNGLLRPHTVALTPSDAGNHDPDIDPDVNQFVLNDVKVGVKLPVTVPTACVSSFKAPHKINGNFFLGGSALVNPPTHWEAFGVNSGVAQEVCARKEFSGNTCNGCHFGDTALDGTSGNNAFTHISPTSGIPATPSKFLTGGGVGFMFGVPDTQFGAGLTSWPFADLLRRHQRLYDIATCTTCSPFFGFDVAFLARMEQVAGVVPFDGLASAEETKFKIGPIQDLERVQQLLELRSEFAKEPRDLPLSFLRPPEVFVH